MIHRTASSLSSPAITFKISSMLSYCIFITILFFDQTHSEFEKLDLRGVRINKCCEPFEILIDSRCTQVNDTTTGRWFPVFTDYDGDGNVQVPNFYFAVGVPECGRMQMWPIYYYPTSRDKLALLPDGRLRHYIQYPDVENHIGLPDDAKSTPMHYDYDQGRYCMEKSISVRSVGYAAEFAMVCSPDKMEFWNWSDSNFLFRKVVHPICHLVSVIILLIVAITYFVLPPLRDLVGNIITTITCCLIVIQLVNLVRIFTEFNNHINILLLDFIFQIGILGSFFWLNSLGYYIWKTFRSRNVFLRVTDGKKYCYYSGYAWCCTITMAGLGIFAHVFLDTNESKKSLLIEHQESIGLLAMLLFSTPLIGIIFANTYFFLSTQKRLSEGKSSSYGRIHHKLKANFIMFSLLFLLMSFMWLFSLSSAFDTEDAFYFNLIHSIIQAPCVLYICVLRQPHVTYLLHKSCCANEAPSTEDWGDEMTYIRTAR